MTPADARPTPPGQRWAAAVLTAFGIAAIVAARPLPFGSITRPGAGFFPLCLAIGLTVVSAAILVRSLRSPDAEARAAGPSRRGLTRAGATFAALFVYAWALTALGFGVATFLFLAFLFRAIEPQRWAVALGGAGATVMASHLLFRVWLGVRLPVGPWGF